MIYILGHAVEYNAFAQLGCRNWSYGKVLPVFCALESNVRLVDDSTVATVPCGRLITAISIGFATYSPLLRKLPVSPSMPTSKALSRQAPTRQRSSLVSGPRDLSWRTICFNLSSVSLRPTDPHQFQSQAQAPAPSARCQCRPGSASGRWQTVASSNSS